MVQDRQKKWTDGRTDDAKKIYPSDFLEGKKANFIQQKVRSYFNIEKINLLVNSKLGKLQKLLHCHLYIPLLEPKLSTSSSKLNKKRTETSQKLIFNLTSKNQIYIWCVPQNLQMSPKFRPRPKTETSSNIILCMKRVKRR